MTKVQLLLSIKRVKASLSFCFTLILLFNSLLIPAQAEDLEQPQDEAALELEVSNMSTEESAGEATAALEEIATEGGEPSSAPTSDSQEIEVEESIDNVMNSEAANENLDLQSSQQTVDQKQEAQAEKQLESETELGDLPEANLEGANKESPADSTSPQLIPSGENVQVETQQAEANLDSAQENNSSLDLPGTSLDSLTEGQEQFELSGEPSVEESFDSQSEVAAESEEQIETQSAADWPVVEIETAEQDNNIFTSSGALDCDLRITKEPLLGVDSQVVISIKNTQQQLIEDLNLVLDLPPGVTFDSGEARVPDFLVDPYADKLNHPQELNPSRSWHRGSLGIKNQRLKFSNLADLESGQELFLVLELQIATDFKVDPKIYWQNPESLPEEIEDFNQNGEVPENLPPEAELPQENQPLYIGDLVPGRLAAEFEVAGGSINQELSFDLEPKGARVYFSGQSDHPQEQLTGLVNAVSRKIIIETSPQSGSLDSAQLEMLNDAGLRLTEQSLSELSAEETPIWLADNSEDQKRAAQRIVADLGKLTAGEKREIELAEYIALGKELNFDLTADFELADLISHNQLLASRISLQANFPTRTSSQTFKAAVSTELRAKHFRVTKELKQINNLPVAPGAQFELNQGDLLDYRLVLRTAQNYQIANISLQDELPLGLKALGETLWQIEKLEPNSEYSQDLTVEVESSYPDNTPIYSFDHFTNRAVAEADLTLKAVDLLTKIKAQDAVKDYALAAGVSLDLALKMEEAQEFFDVNEDAEKVAQLRQKIGDRIDLKLTYQNPSGNQAKNQLIALKLPQGFRPLIESVNYNYSDLAHFNQQLTPGDDLKVLWLEAQFNPESEPFFDQEQNSLYWFLGDTSAGSELTITLTVEVEDDGSLYNHQKRQIFSRLTGKTSINKESKIYSRRQTAPLQIIDPVLKVTKEAFDAEGNDLSSEENFRAFINANSEKEMRVLYRLTIVNQGGATAYEAKLKDLPETKMEIEEILSPDLEFKTDLDSGDYLISSAPFSLQSGETISYEYWARLTDLDESSELEDLSFINLATAKYASRPLSETEAGMITRETGFRSNPQQKNVAELVLKSTPEEPLAPQIPIIALEQEQLDLNSEGEITGKAQTTSFPADQVRYRLQLTNLADLPAANLEVRINISGLADAASQIVDSSGELVTQDNQLVWQLAGLAPEEREEVYFDLALPADLALGEIGVFAKLSYQDSTQDLGDTLSYPEDLPSDWQPELGLEPVFFTSSSLQVERLNLAISPQVVEQTSLADQLEFAVSLTEDELALLSSGALEIEIPSALELVDYDADLVFENTSFKRALKLTDISKYQESDLEMLFAVRPQQEQSADFKEVLIVATITGENTEQTATSSFAQAALVVLPGPQDGDSGGSGGHSRLCLLHPESCGQNLNPQKRSLVINNNQQYANSLPLNLEINTRDATHYRVILETGETSDWYLASDQSQDSNRKQISEIINQEFSGLTKQLEDGKQKLSAEFKYGPTDWIFADKVSDEIILDRAAPELSIVSFDAKNQIITLNLADQTSGLKSLAFKVVQPGGQSTESVWQHFYFAGDQEKTLEIDLKERFDSLDIDLTKDYLVYLRATDQAGNQGQIQSKASEGELELSDHDILTINQNQKYTATRFVFLNTKLRDDLVKMRFCNAETSTSSCQEEWSSWQDYSLLKFWELSSNYETKKVLAEYQTRSGQIIAAADEIIYAPLYAADFELVDNPLLEVDNSGARWQGKVKITNQGTKIWPQEGVNPIRLSYHLYQIESNGERKLISWDNTRFQLPQDLSYGQAVTLEPQVVLPVQAGKYEIEFDLVEEFVTWFKAKGVETLKVPEEVTVNAASDQVEEILDDQSSFFDYLGISDQVGYDLEIAGRWIEYQGQKYQIGNTPRITKGELFTQVYLVRNIGQRSWNATDTFRSDEQSVPIGQRVAPGKANVFKVETKAPSNLNFKLYTWKLYRGTTRLARSEDFFLKAYFVDTEPVVTPEPQITSITAISSSPSVIAPTSKISIKGSNFENQLGQVRIDGNLVNSSDITSIGVGWRAEEINLQLRSDYLNTALSSHQICVTTISGKATCKTGVVISAEATCTATSKTMCHGSNVFRQDSCGQPTEPVDYCQNQTETCQENASQTSASCVSLSPKITGITPGRGLEGDLVRIKGQSLTALSISDRLVYLHNTETNSRQAIGYRSWQPEEVQFRVPSLPAGQYKVNLGRSGSEAEGSLDFTIESNWCAQRASDQPENLELIARPGSQLNLSLAFQNNCQEDWSAGSKVAIINSSFTADELTLNSPSLLTPVVYGQSNSFATEISLSTNLAPDYTPGEVTVALVDAVDSSKKSELVVISLSPPDDSQALPQITSCPQAAQYGEVITIEGSNFSELTSDQTKFGKVMIGSVAHEGGQIISWNSERIEFKVSSALAVGDYDLWVELANGLTSNSCSIQINPAPPHITKAYPNPNYPSRVLTIEGENFQDLSSLVKIFKSTAPDQAYLHLGTKILTWQEDLVEIVLDSNIDVSSSDYLLELKNSRGDYSNRVPVSFSAPPECELKTLAPVPLKVRPHLDDQNNLVAIIPAQTVLTPVEYGHSGTDHNGNGQLEETEIESTWIHVITDRYQGWVEDNLSLNTAACSILTLDIPQVTIEPMWKQVKRGELTYVSVDKEIQLLNDLYSFPPQYNGNSVIEGERMYVLKIEGDFTKVLTDTGKVGWLDASYLKIAPNPKEGMLLFPLAGDKKATQEYGWSEYALLGLYDGEKHTGIDIRALDFADGKGCGAPVFNTKSGKIKTICDADDPNFYCADNQEARNKIGNLVVIDHGLGLTTQYGHLQVDSIPEVLKQGYLNNPEKLIDNQALIGRTGNTGDVKGDPELCHLHFSVYQNSETSNPYLYFTAEGRYLEGDLGGVGSDNLTINQRCNSFSDIDKNAVLSQSTPYLCSDFTKALNKSIIKPANSKNNYQFSTANSVNRAEFTKMVLEAKGITPDKNKYKNCFSDVKADWYAPYVCYAKERGWVQGEGTDGLFHPEKSILYPAALKITLEAFNFEPENSNCNKGWHQSTDPLFWYFPYLHAAGQKNIIDIIPNNGEFNKSLSKEFSLHLIIKVMDYGSFEEKCPSEDYTYYINSSSGFAKVRTEPSAVGGGDTERATPSNWTPIKVITYNSFIGQDQRANYGSTNWYLIDYGNKPLFVLDALVYDDAWLKTMNLNMFNYSVFETANGRAPRLVDCPSDSLLSKYLNANDSYFNLSQKPRYDWKADRYQYLNSDSFYLNTIITYSPDFGLFDSPGKLLISYGSAGGACGMGVATDTKQNAANSSFGTSGYYYPYELGHIYYNTTKEQFYPVYGNIYKFHESYGEGSGTYGPLGFPVSNASWQNGKLIQEFENNQKVMWTGNPKDMAQLIEDDCQLADYSFEIASKWPEYINANDPNQNSLALKIRPKNANNWNNEVCKLKLSRLSNNGDLTATTANFMKQADGTYKATMSGINKQTSEACETQDYRIHVSKVGVVGEKISWVVGNNTDGCEREFKTSIDNVKLYDKYTNVDLAKPIKTIKEVKTHIKVVGKAVAGDFINEYHTDRWYRVKYDDKYYYVPTPAIHIIKLGNEKNGFIEIDDDFIALRMNRQKYSKITAIVLHFTTNNSTAKGARGSSRNRSGIGAQYFLDRNGNIAQSVPDYYNMGHSGYGGTQKSIRGHHLNEYLNGNSFTIGIEISNFGVAVEGIDKNGVKIYKNAYDNIYPSDQVVNVSALYPKIWSVWTDSNNYAWGWDGDKVNRSQQTWQSYPENQLENLVLLIEYLQDRYGIPFEFFQYDNPHDYKYLQDNNKIKLSEQHKDKYSWYYYPSNIEERSTYNDKICSIKAYKIVPYTDSNGKEKSIKYYYQSDLSDSSKYYWGIIGHHNVTGKYDPGPALNIDDLIRIRQNRE